jgi:hypothetical protein
MRTRFLRASLLLFTCACARQPPATTTPIAPEAAANVERAAPRALHRASAIKVLAGLLPPLEQPVTSFGATSDGSYLYTLGGYDGEPHAYSREGQHKRLARLRLDGSGAWEELGALPEGLQGLGLVHHAGKLCRVGGTAARNARGTPADLHSVADVACFDLARKTWSDLPALPAGRSSHDAALIGSVLYVAGGWTLNGQPGAGTFRDELLLLDLDKPAAGWSAVPLPFQRRALGVAAVGGKLVMVGGISPEGEPSRRVDVYDAATRSFSRGPDYPDDAFGVAVETLGDAVVASARGGVVYRWQPGTGSWQPVARLAFGRFFHHLVSGASGELIAVGGISGMHDAGRTTHVERLALAAPSPRVVAWSMAYPGAAKNRQGIFVHGDDVYLFGGNNSLEQHDFEPHNFVDQTLRLHLPSLQLAELAPFPARRQSMQTLSRAEQGVTLGGFGHDGEKAVSFAESYLFDFGSERWSRGASLPESRTQFGLAEHHGELWVFGGLNYDPSRQGPDAFRHVLNLLHGKPEQSPTFAASQIALPAPRRAFAGAALGDEYFLLGGMRGGFELVDDCLRYNFTTQSFAPFACPGSARLSGALVPVGGKLYLAGGSIRGPGGGKDGLHTAQDKVELDPASGAFRSVIAELPFDTRHMHAVAFQDRVLLISTHNDAGRIDLAIIDP